ncbi:MAG: TRAP transporter large permease subunit [Pseudomonadota bacterium]
MPNDVTAFASTDKFGALVAGVALAAITGAVALNVVGRLAGLPLVGANVFAVWCLPLLAVAALLRPPQGAVSAMVAAFAMVTLGVGCLAAAERVGGREAVLGLSAGLRYGLLAGLIGLAACVALARRWRMALVVALGGALALVPWPALPFWGGALVFCALLALRVPVALALMAAVALAPGRLSDAALAQTFVRGVSLSVLIAVPLFVFAAALMVRAGIAEAIAVAVRRLVGARRGGLGAANIGASLVMGGVSASSLADAATSARLFTPAMVENGDTPARAAAVSAAGAILPNIVPPSIALLLAASAADLSVGDLWLAGAIAAPVFALSLVLAARLRAPPAPAAPPQPAAGALWPFLALFLLLVAVLRFGIATPVEIGVVAVALAMVFAARKGGGRAILAAAGAAGRDAAAILFLIGAAAPVATLFALEGVDPGALLATLGPFAALCAAVGLALLVGAVLDAGAAILLFMPSLVPALVASGVGPIHAALVVTIALLIGGLTPPVGVLALVAAEAAGAGMGVFVALVPFLLALLGALFLVAAVPFVGGGFV